MADPTPAPPQFVDPPDPDAWGICPLCRGTGYRRHDQPYRPCDQCDQVGRLAYRGMWLCAQCATDAVEALHEASS
jgi:hypothetical protein